MSWFKDAVKAVENVGRSVGEALGLRSPKEDPGIRSSADAQLREQERFYAALRMREQSALSQERLQVALGDTPGLTGGDTVDLSSLTIPFGDSTPEGALRGQDEFGKTMRPIPRPLRSSTYARAPWGPPSDRNGHISMGATGSSRGVIH